MLDQSSIPSMVKEKSIDIEVKVFFKNSIFLSTTGLQYYEWIDRFLDKLEEEYSQSYFFKKLGGIQYRLSLITLIEVEKIMMMVEQVHNIIIGFSSLMIQRRPLLRR